MNLQVAAAVIAAGPAEYGDKTVGVNGDELSLAEAAEVFTRVFGKQVGAVLHFWEQVGAVLQFGGQVGAMLQWHCCRCVARQHTHQSYNAPCTFRSCVHYLCRCLR